MLTRDSYCSFCGTAFTPPLAYPRTCGKCQTQIWANPIPVSIVLLPVLAQGKTGLLVIRRAIEPGKGKLALVGGFLEEHETWAVGGAREMKEETGLTVDPASLEAFWFCSTEPRPNRVLLFSVAKPMPAEGIAPFAPDHETSERGVIFGPRGLESIFAFPLHIQAAQRFFRARGLEGEHAFTPL